MKNRLITAGLIVSLALAALPLSAYAQCLVNDVSTACDNGYVGGNNQTIIVPEDQVINNPNGIPNGDGILAGSNVTVINNGEIIAGDTGVTVNANSTVINNGEMTCVWDCVLSGNGNTYNTFINNGTINGNDDALNGRNHDTMINNGLINTNDDGIVGSGSFNTITNTGTIDVNDQGINALNNNTVTNDGTIIATTGIYMGATNNTTSGNNNIITNNGDITTTGDGIYVRYNNTIVNDGTIIAGENGISTYDGNTIINNGTIISNAAPNNDLANPEHAIWVGWQNGSNTVLNNGTVLSYNDNAIDFDNNSSGLVENYGVISGVVGVNATDGTGSQTVINTGTLIGTGGVALNLGSGDDAAYIEVSSTVDGLMNGGANTDSLTFMYTFEAEDFFIPAEYEAIRAQLASLDLTTCPCTIGMVVNGLYFEYTFTNFEFLDTFLRFVKVTFTPYEEMNCQNGVKCFALKDKAFRNGNVQIYAAEGDQGVAVATVNFRLLGTSGYTFTNEDNGWTVIITYNGTDGDALTYSIVLSKGGDVRNAGTVVLAFQYADSNAATHALAWR